MIVNCPNCPAKFNNDTVAECPLCAQKYKKKTPQKTAREQSSEHFSAEVRTHMRTSWRHAD